MAGLLVLGDAVLQKTLTESFIALADEVQSLIDRKTILEHKLRFAHEQYQCLADKYAPAVPEVAETLAKLQLPPDYLSQYSVATNSSTVPLPRRTQPGNSRHEIALQIREGRKAAQLIAAAMGRASKQSDSSKEASTSPVTAADTMTTMSTVLEKDFTVEGKKKGLLACPFSAAAAAATPPAAVQDQASPNLGIGSVTGDGVQGQHAAAGADAAGALNNGDGAMDPTPHKSSDPICAAMYEDSTSMPAHTAASKCPIRFLDQHSPEEIARYVETHKHEIPRSHEVCVRRYQKNEEQVRKLDAKYGNLVNMIEDLSHLHKPMLPSPAMGGYQYQDPEQVDRASNERVANWAKSVSANDPQAPPEDQADQTNLPVEDEEEREGRFDRPLREVRLGESPSRPWGIPVPAMEDLPSRQRSRSPSPARPVLVPSRPPVQEGNGPPHKKGPGGAGKCPFDHTKMAAFAAMGGPKVEQPPKQEAAVPPRETAPKEMPNPKVAEQSKPLNQQHHIPQPMPTPQPTFINMADMPIPKAETAGQQQAQAPVVFNFNGPVFIGYPMEQAIQFMQQFQGNNNK
ncbi:hypothetical protein B0T20DRAFT_453678 [Sordaria brevicollis]|uniref:Uncharacterized protein n=1 Tax=Sordaria brevicollis TaxID=83679 RepID=A0AAE0PD14_SORBR|nr:hypothetical protein B0T20DRAFT_453678 [Sordaria brevicollis]